MNFIPEKTQEQTFDRILSLKENQECADCSAKHPAWSSIDFGVMICMKCAGISFSANWLIFGRLSAKNR
jgi:Putative GTPase activating protein for Arf